MSPVRQADRLRATGQLPGCGNDELLAGREELLEQRSVRLAEHAAAPVLSSALSAVDLPTNWSQLGCLVRHVRHARLLSRPRCAHVRSGAMDLCGSAMSPAGGAA
jgi:hypothetical protein